MPKIANFLDFCEESDDIRQRNDNQPPNPFFAIIVAEKLRDYIKNLDFSGRVWYSIANNKVQRSCARICNAIWEIPVLLQKFLRKGVCR